MISYNNNVYWASRYNRLEYYTNKSGAGGKTGQKSIRYPSDFTHFWLNHDKSCCALRAPLQGELKLHLTSLCLHWAIAMPVLKHWLWDGLRGQPLSWALLSPLGLNWAPELPRLALATQALVFSSSPAPFTGTADACISATVNCFSATSSSICFLTSSFTAHSRHLGWMATHLPPSASGAPVTLQPLLRTVIKLFKFGRLVRKHNINIHVYFVFYLIWWSALTSLKAMLLV